MFQGPAAHSHGYDDDDVEDGGASGFKSNFDFSRRQVFSANGFNTGSNDGMENASSPPAASFADFAAFGEIASSSSGPIADPFAQNNG